MEDQEPWHIEIREQYLFNRPGEGAREVERRLAEGKSGFRRFVESALDVKSDERNWRRGARGEEVVGRRLDQLPRESWAVVHDLTIGTRGANLDHLVIGPPGVFALNTKHLTGKVTAYDKALLHNGHKTTYVRDSMREARTVQQRLSAAVGREVRAWGVIVLMGCELDVKKRPVNCSVVGRKHLPGWFLRLPGQTLAPGEVLELERAARTPSTWLPGAKPPPPPSSPPEPRVPADGASTSTPGVRAPAEDGFAIRRWRRYGHDRLYANLADGRRVGWVDVATGAITIELAEFNETGGAALRQALAELRASDS